MPHRLQLAILTAALFLAVSLAPARSAAQVAETEADPTLAWNAVLREAILASELSNPAAIRVGAIVHIAMFDAYNSIDRHYEAIHVAREAPQGASAQAALSEAAHATMLAFFPTQAARFDAQRTRSLAAMARDEAAAGIEQGLIWGRAVARETLAWRARDGFEQIPPAFFGGGTVGQWRSTSSPPASMAAQNMGLMRPFVLSSATQFVYPPPRRLGNAQWTTDFEEVKQLGAKNSHGRTADQTAIAFFWNGYATVDWSEAAEEIARRRHVTRAESARLFALLNIALADTAVTTFNAKRRYGADPAAVTWRPVTAIPLAEQDGNPATEPDPNWQPLIATPNHPEYPASHPATNGAGAELLRLVFGDEHAFTLHPQFGPTLPTPTGLRARAFTRLSAAEREGNEARIFGGMHYRSSVEASAAMGHAIARHVFTHAAQPAHSGGENSRK